MVRVGVLGYFSPRAVARSWVRRLGGQGCGYICPRMVVHSWLGQEVRLGRQLGGQVVRLGGQVRRLGSQVRKLGQVVRLGGQVRQLGQGVRVGQVLENAWQHALELTQGNAWTLWCLRFFLLRACDSLPYMVEKPSAFPGHETLSFTW